VAKDQTGKDTVDQQLLKAQYQWLQFRNQQCLFEAQASTLAASKPALPNRNPNSQSSQQASHQNSNQVKLCQLALTRERIEYLQWFLGR